MKGYWHLGDSLAMRMLNNDGLYDYDFNYVLCRCSLK